MSEQIEAKGQYKKFCEKMKQYVLREFQNREDIIILVRDLKYLATVLSTSRTTALSALDEKDPINVMI